MYRGVSDSRPQRYAAQAKRSPVTDAASVAALTRLIDQKIADTTASQQNAAPLKPQRRNLWLRGDLLQAAPAGRSTQRAQRRRPELPPAPVRRRRRRSKTAARAVRAARSAGRAQRASANRLRVALTWLLTSALMLATAATAYELLNPALMPAQARLGALATAVRAQVLPAGEAAAPVAVSNGAALAEQVQALREDNILLQDRVYTLRAKLTHSVTGAEASP